MSDKKKIKQRAETTIEQKLEHAKLMVDEVYSNQKVVEISGASDSAVSRCWGKSKPPFYMLSL